MAEDHARREDERCPAKRVVVHGLHASVVDGPVSADLVRSNGTQVSGAAVQRLQVPLWPLLLGLDSASVTPLLRPWPALQRCTAVVAIQFHSFIHSFLYCQQMSKRIRRYI